MASPAMKCSCIGSVNALMKERNSEVDLVFLLDDGSGKSGVTVKIATKKLNPKKRGKAVTIVPTFCPFCGDRLVEEDA